MTNLDLKVSLPDSLAQEARRMGLLEPENLQTLLRDAVRSRRLDRLSEARKRVAEAGIAPLTMEEIQAEIEADRAEQRAKPAQ